jgi:hypothetical protein
LITNALDGSELHLGRSDMVAYWSELNMDEVRARTIDEVCTLAQEGRLDWSYELLYGLVEAFPKRGQHDVLVEGQSDEGSEDPNEPGQAWRDDVVSSEGEQEEEQQPQEGANAVAVVALDAAQEAEAARHAARLRALDAVAEAAQGDARLLNSLDRVRATTLKEATGRSQADAAVAQAVRARERARGEAAETLQGELDRRKKARAQQADALAAVQRDLDQRIAELRRREIALDAANRRGADMEAARKRRAELQAVAVGFTVNELGQGQPKGGGEVYRNARLQLLDSVHRLAGELPAELEARWGQWRRRYDARGCLHHDRAWGSVFRDSMRELVEKVCHEGAAAFRAWHHRWTRRWVLDHDDVSVPAPPAP